MNPLNTTTRSRINFAKAKAAYDRGENVIDHLREQLGAQGNTTEIIELAYDLQAGTYVAETLRNRKVVESYASELATILDFHLRDGDSLLDIGCGEMTNLSLLTTKLSHRISELYAFDISWSRIKVGLGFASKTLAPDLYRRLKPFTADIENIPLRSKSIDVSITSHALEPNGGRETELLKEILRVTRRIVVLFEPSYELNSDDGRMRMDRLGYVKNLEKAALDSGAKVIGVVPLRNNFNPLNPTAAYVIDPNLASYTTTTSGELFSDPGSDDHLEKHDGFYFSRASALSYPVLGGIPVLRSSAAILTSALGM